MPVWLVADMPFHNAFMISLFETGNFCAGLNTAVNSNRNITVEMLINT